MPRLALLYPGDREARLRADPAASRLAPLFAALAQAGLPAEPTVYHDEFADEVEAQLRGVAAVLVWCNPIEQGRDRRRLDALLERLQAAGVFVSAAPAVILKMGTKDLLWRCQGLPFALDAQRVADLAQLRAELPARLTTGPRVLKQWRGHSGIGVWRVERLQDGRLLVQHAQRGCQPELVDEEGLCSRLAPYFEEGRPMVDQAWAPRLAEGMLRAYLVGRQVVGFGHQTVVALHPQQLEPGPRLYHPADEPRFQGLRRRLEGGWLDLLAERLELDEADWPLLWDADFLFGGGSDFLLCEINVSSVLPFPPSAVAPLVAALRQRLGAAP